MNSGALRISGGIFFAALLVTGCAIDTSIERESEAERESLGAAQQAVVSPPGAWDVLATQVSAEGGYLSGGFACARETNARVSCWGSNAYGELGRGTTGGIGVYAKRLTTPSSVTTVGTGQYHACAARSSDGVVQCWGRSTDGEVGTLVDGSYPSPVTVSGMTSAGSFGQVGADFSCAIRSGTVRCWGDDSAGQLGTTSSSADSAVPLLVDTLTSVTALAQGPRQACAIQSGALYCWGIGAYDGAAGTHGSPYSVPVPEPIVSVGVGEVYVCAVGQSGAVYCLGNSNYAQTGTYSSSYVAHMTQVPDVAGAVEVSAGSLHACARLSNGAMKCWGNNASGQLGNGTTATYLPPVQVSGLGGVTSISAGRYLTCAVANPGVAYCWGINSSGQVGDGTTTSPRTTPRRVQFQPTGG